MMKLITKELKKNQDFLGRCDWGITLDLFVNYIWIYDNWSRGIN